MTSLSVSQDQNQAVDFKSFTSFLEENLRKKGYEMVRECSCKRDPTKERIKELNDTVERYFKSTGKLYEPPEEKKLYKEYVRCFHYKSQNLGHLVITVEGFDETMGDFLGQVKQDLIRDSIVRKQVRSEGDDTLGHIKGAIENYKKVKKRLDMPVDLGIVSLYTYGNSIEGREEDTCFACKEGKISLWNQSWGQRLGLPQTVKRVDEDFLQSSDK